MEKVCQRQIGNSAGSAEPKGSMVKDTQETQTDK